MIGTFGTHSLNSYLHSFLIEPAALLPLLFYSCTYHIDLQFPWTENGRGSQVDLNECLSSATCYKFCVILHRLHNLSEPISSPEKISIDNALQSVRRIKSK